MNVTLINDWYMTTDSGGQMGTTNNTGVTNYQKHNATKVYNYFNSLGWSLSAIAGMLGNMQLESWLSPALIQGTHRSRLPNSASSLSDVPNNVMINFYDSYYGLSNGGFGVGLVQWDGYTATSPAGQKLVSFAERYNLNWYDGDTQLFRIKREKETNIQWTSYTINGIRWTWDNYPTNTQTPEVSAHVWQACYEVSATGTLPTRESNARYWYDYFYDNPPEPPTPTGWITGAEFADLATAYDPAITGVNIPYDSKDCFAYVSMVWHDIPAVASTDKLVSPQSPSSGTNSLWRQNMTNYPVWTFNTTSPDNQNPTPVLWYKESISNYLADNSDLPTGCLLFHKIGEDDTPVIPSYYRGDGIGNYAHVGIYIGNCQVMQSGGRDASSVPGRGVHRSTYSSLTSSSFQAAWNYMAYVVWVDTSGSEPGPGPGPEPPDPGDDILKYLLLWYNNNKRKGVKKHVIRY